MVVYAEVYPVSINRKFIPQQFRVCHINGNDILRCKVRCNQAVKQIGILCRDNIRIFYPCRFSQALQNPPQRGSGAKGIPVRALMGQN